MKRRVRFSLSFILSLACSLALLAVSALAQDQEFQEAKKKAAAEKAAEKAAVEVEIKIREDMFKVVGAKIGFEMKVVKGAPYSATAEAETIQTLADGNRIRNKTTTLVHRDGEGRTRREGVGKAQSVATEVFISDPTSGVNYSLDTQRRIAVKVQVDLQEIELMKTKLAAVEIKERTQESGQAPSPVEGNPMKRKKRRPVTESLGKQVIEGVECEGTRTTLTIPADAIGNELPLNIVSEEWYSPELQVLVLTKQNDPRNGETTYRLTNINRGEPDRALFEVPADYTLRDKSPLPVKKRRLEEQ